MVCENMTEPGYNPCIVSPPPLQHQPGKLDVGRPQPLKELAEDFRHLSYLWIFTLTFSVGNLASLAYVEAWLMARTNIACIGWKSTEVSIRAEQKPRPILPAVSVRPHTSDSQEERKDTLSLTLNPKP